MFTEFEVEVLDTLWKAERDLTKPEILGLSENRTWKKASLPYIIKTLIGKGAIEESGYRKTDVSHHSLTYRVLVSPEEFAAMYLSDVVPSANFAGVFSSLVGKGNVNEETLREMQRILDELEEKKRS